MATGLAILCWACSAGAATEGYGKLTGVVFDPGGTPQMGVAILLTPEAVADLTAPQLLTNQNGIFSSGQLRPGLYSARATLAGFLPTIQQHIRISANLTTLVRIELDSVFSSLDHLRGQSPQSAQIEDWKWVLRTSAASRPVMQLVDGTLVVDEGEGEGQASPRLERARLEMTHGSVQPGSPTALPGLMGTAFAYDQKLGAAGRLVLAGQAAYDPAANDGSGLSGGVATFWLPNNAWGSGPVTSVVAQQIEVAPGVRPGRALRVGHSEQMALSDDVLLKYGGDLVVGGVNGMTAVVRPRVSLAWRDTPEWTIILSLETDPEANLYSMSEHALPAAIDALSTAPVLIWRDGQVSALQGGWHEEIALRRILTPTLTLEASGFHDHTGHQAVFGIDETPNLSANENILNRAYAHDAGPGGAWGARMVLQQKIATHLEAAGIYTFAGGLALAPVAPDASFQDLLRTRGFHSVAGRFSGTLPRGGTQFSASYKWIYGQVVGRQDLFGESALGVDPYLSFTVRQPLPAFRHFGAGHWEAMASVRNVLAQGYVAANSLEGAMILMPVERSFQGGLSFQF